MEPDPSLFLLLIPFLLLLSALFSATETAFFSLNSLMIDKLAARMDKKSKRVARLLSSPRKLLIAILIGNTLVNVTVSSLAALLVTHWARINRFDPHIAMVVNIVLVTFLILLLSEISPKILAAKKPESLALYLVPFVTLIYFLFLPFSILIDKGMNWLMGF